MDRSVGKPLILSIDIGTSSVRSALFDLAGRMQRRGFAQLTWRVDSPEPGAAEIAPQTLIRQVSQCLDRTLADAGSAARRVAAVGCSCFWHSLIGLDAKGRPLTPILTWADTRPQSAMRWLARRVDAMRSVRRNGCPLHASYWPAKLRWLRQRDARLFRQVKLWVSPADYLFRELLGDADTSHSMASATGLYDRRAEQWDGELTELLGVDPRRLGAIRPLDECMSGLRADWAARWPALARTSWVRAVGDGAASNVGAGCVVPSDAALMVGTSAAVRVALLEEPPRLPRGLWCYRIEHGRPLIGGAISNGGMVFDWLRRTLRLGRRFEEQLAELPPAAHGLTVLPLLAGERTPNWRADVTGVLAGLTARTGPVEIAQAFLEAVAFRCADMVERVDGALGEPAPLVGTGSALRRSRVWPQMIADVLGREVALSAVEEASLRGAAMLAAEAVGLTDAMALRPQVEEIVEPDDDRAAVYADARRRMARLYERHFG